MVGAERMTTIIKTGELGFKAVCWHCGWLLDNEKDKLTVDELRWKAAAHVRETNGHNVLLIAHGSESFMLEGAGE